MFILSVFPCQDFSFRRGESDERRRHIPSEIGTAMRYPSYLERGPDYEAEMRYYTGDSLTSPHGRVRSIADRIFLEIIIISIAPQNDHYTQHTQKSLLYPLTNNHHDTHIWLVGCGTTGSMLDSWYEGRWFDPRYWWVMSRCISDDKEVKGVFRYPDWVCLAH